jgi:hypothetical protein
MAINPNLLVIKPVDELQSVTGLQEGEILFYDVSDADVPLKKISIDTFNNISKTAKPLKPTDGSPSIEGLYMPTESGAYANAGGLVAQEGYYTLFFYDGINWTKSESELPMITVASDFDPANDTDAQGARQISEWIKDSPENIGATKYGSLPEINVPLTFIQDAYVWIDGTINSIGTAEITDFIDIPQGYSKLEVDRSDEVPISFWTEDEGFIVAIQVSPVPQFNYQINIPSNARKVIYCRSKLNIQDASLKFLEVVSNNYYKFDDILSKENKLAGKKIAWFGTSIPAGYPKENNQNTWAYPNIIANRNFASIYNNSVPNGVIRSFKSDGSSLGSPRNLLAFTNVSNAVNYENKILEVIGTSNEPDIIVFDYGVNDYDSDPTDINNYASFNMTSESLNTFMGSLNFVIKKVLEQRPNMKIYLITHYSDDSFSPGIASFSNVNRAIEKVGQYWSIPTLQLCYKTGWVIKNGINVIDMIMDDTIHPAAAPTPVNVNKLADIIEGFLLTN